MPLTYYVSKQVTCYLFGRVTFEVPEVLYLALSTTAPSGSKRDNWGFVEPTHDSYNRAIVNNDLITWGAALDDDDHEYVQQNNIKVEFDRAMGSWGHVTHYGFWDKPTDGRLLVYEELETPQTITTGDSALFENGAITIYIS